MSDRTDFTAKLVVNNFRDDNRPVTVWMEPEGADYTLMPRESFEIIAYGTSFVPWFDVAATDTDLTICIEGGPQEYAVFKQGKRISMGHHREFAHWLKP